MTPWRTRCLVLGAICLGQLWCNLRPVPAELTNAKDCPAAPSLVRAELARTTAVAAPEPHPEPTGEPPDDGVALYGFRVPSWVAWLAPHPGEDLRSFRDRVLPLGMAVLAPQRARVSRSRDSFLAKAGLDPGQRAALDAASRETAEAVQDRVMSAVLGDELSPAAFKPMTGVALAYDVLEIVRRGNQRFVEALREDQRAALARHPFDFADYVVFSTRWEDALGP